MLVENVMTKNVTTIKSYATLKEALELMKKNNLKALVVEKNSSSDAYGLITNTQILKAILAENGDIELINVYDVYNKPAFSVSAKIDIKHAVKLMIEHNIKRVVVTDSNELEGVLSLSDLTHYLMSLVE